MGYSYAYRNVHLDIKVLAKMSKGLLTDGASVDSGMEHV